MKWSLKGNVPLLIVATSVISAATGAAVSYVVTAKIASKKTDEILAVEIDKAKVFYQNMYSTPSYVEEPSDGEERLLEAVREATREVDPEPEDLVGKALEAASVYSARSDFEEEDRPVPPTAQVTNIFINNTPPGEEVLDALMRDRDPSEPYIITKEEFYQNDPDFEQKAFTYYEGDGILVDDKDEFNPIMDVEAVAGEDNLLRFGYGSADEDVLYVRNEVLDPPLDLHITRSSGKYSVEVMAFDDDTPHLEHTHKQRFRIYDE